MDFSECHPIGDDRALRQGDLIRSTSGKAQPFEAIGIIVTADCDIALEKHGGLLSYVPAIPALDYIELFILPKRIERVLNALGKRISSAARGFQESNRPEYSKPLSGDRVLAWILEVGPESVADQLQVDESASRSKFAADAAAYTDLMRAEKAPLSEKWASLSHAMRTIGRAKSPDEASRQLSSDIESSLKKLPGDALFLSNIDGIGNPHVVYLRLMREIRDRQIALSPMRQSCGVTHERFGRLKTPYIYHLTQKLGNVFSSIGLPTEYENERAATTATIVPIVPIGLREDRAS